jgi:Fur family peroxide stress response transcriptional regulator
MQSVQQYLIDHGIGPTIQRLVIMDYLLTHRTHPTVHEIYTDLLPQIPTLSKTTVHNTLRFFVERKIVRHIDIDERNARFDGEIEAHAHFRCKKCGCILDIPLPEIKNLFPQEPDFSIEDAYVNIKGYCKNCIISLKESYL